MPRDFFPDRESDQLAWSRNLIDALTPDPLAWGFTPEQLEAYREVRALFESTYRLANATSRSSLDVIRKNEAKREHERASRVMGRILSARPGITSTDRRVFGLCVPDDATASEAANRAPEIYVSTEPGRCVRVRLRATHGESGGYWRKRPAGASAAMLFYHVGESLPESDAGWTFYAQTTQTRVAMHLPGSLRAGSLVWVRACWVRTKGLAPGAMSNPAHTRLLDGVSATRERVAA